MLLIPSGPSVQSLQRSIFKHKFEPYPSVSPGDLTSFKPFECDVTGGIKDDIFERRFCQVHYPGTVAWASRNRATSNLYPEESSAYHFFTQRKTVRIIFSGWTESGSRSCVLPCPIPAFSEGGYTAMWMCVVIPGGLCE